MIIVAVLICLRAGRLPANLSADDCRIDHREHLEQQLDDAVSHQNWTAAQQYAESLLDITPADLLRRPLETQLTRCRANAAILRRYADDSLRRFIQNTSANDARKILEEVIRLIHEKSCLTVNSCVLLNGALNQLREITHNTNIVDQYQADLNALKPLQHHIEQLIEQKNAIESNDTPLNCNDIKKITDTLRDSAVKARFGPAWPDIELAAALISSLDPYSDFFGPDQSRCFTNRINGNYLGFGVDLTFEGRYPGIFDVVRDSPAEKAGILPGDAIIAIAGQSTGHRSSEDIGRLFKTYSNNPLELICRRNDREFKCSLKARPINAPSVRYIQMLPSEKSVGYFHIAGFHNDTAMEIRRAMTTLEQSNADAVIIDLRDNGGGIFSAGLDAIAIFLTDKPILTLKSKNSATQYNAESYGFETYDVPLVLLVNQHTASAAEIFAGALQLHHRALVIGQPTRGKKSVQTVFALASCPMAISLTTATWTFDGEDNLASKKLQPDIVMGNPNPQHQYHSMTFYVSCDNPLVKKAMDSLLISSI